MKRWVRAAKGGVLLLMALASAGPAAGAGPAIESWMQGEGTTVILVEDHRAPLVSLRVEFPAGNWSSWAREVHAEEAFEIQLHDSAGQLRAKADRLAAGVSVYMGSRASTLQASFLKEDLDEVMELVRDIFSNRDFDRGELKLRKKQLSLNWHASLKIPFFRGAQEAARLLFAKGDPRRTPWEKPEPLETDISRLATARETLIRLPGRVVAFAGDLTREEADGAATGLLPPVSDAPPEGLLPDLAPVRPASARSGDVTVRIPRLTQVYFGYGRDSLPYTHTDYPAYLVADHVLGGHFYSRLYVALRHEGGETYGAGSSNRGDVDVGLYGMSTFTRTSNAVRTEGKLREVLRLFHEKGISEEERVAAVGFLAGRKVFQRQSPDQILGRYLLERRQGLPHGFTDELADRASALSLEEINRFISGYYEPSSFTMIRVAPIPGSGFDMMQGPPGDPPAVESERWEPARDEAPRYREKLQDTRRGGNPGGAAAPISRGSIGEPRPRPPAGSHACREGAGPSELAALLSS